MTLQKKHNGYAHVISRCKHAAYISKVRESMKKENQLYQGYVAKRASSFYTFVYSDDLLTDNLTSRSDHYLRIS